VPKDEANVNCSAGIPIKDVDDQRLSSQEQTILPTISACFLGNGTALESYNIFFEVVSSELSWTCANLVSLRLNVARTLQFILFVNGTHQKSQNTQTEQLIFRLGCVD